jgi:hypothetical protein
MRYHRAKYSRLLFGGDILRMSGGGIFGLGNGYFSGFLCSGFGTESFFGCLVWRSASECVSCVHARGSDQLCILVSPYST